MSKIQLLLDVVDNMRALADSIQTVANTMRENETAAPVKPETGSVAEQQPVSDPIPVPKPVKPVEETMAAKKAQKTVTLPEVRAALGKLSQDGYTEQIRALIRKYGADRLGEVDPANYSALLKEAEELPHAAK